MTRASILIPTHNRPETLALAVASVLAQTVDDLEVIIIGDGVTDDLRQRAVELVAGDSRVRFLDFPKGPSHGEIYRHEAIAQASSNAIFYLCDDDLLLPDHVASLLELLAEHTLVQSLNGYVLRSGAVRRYPGSLSDSRAIASLLRDRPRDNFVSITGTAHRRDFYLDGGRYWQTTPAGDWPDRYQWARLIQLPTFSGATSARMTALQFPATDPERVARSGDAALTELRMWAERIARPDAQSHVDDLVAQGTEHDLGVWYVTARDRELEIFELNAVLHERNMALHDVHVRLDQHQRTVSWRLTLPLRAVRARFRRH